MKICIDDGSTNIKLAWTENGEQKIAQLLGDAWNLYLTLPVEHPMGRDEFCRAIHHCQNMVLARPAIRVLARKGQGYKR